MNMVSCVQFADLPLVNSVDKLVRTTEHKQNDELTHHISRIKAPGGGGGGYQLTREDSTPAYVAKMLHKNRCIPWVTPTRGTQRK